MPVKETTQKISLPFGSEMKLKCVNIIKHVFPMRLLFKVLVSRGNIKDWLFDENLTVFRFTGSCMLIAIIYRLVRKYIFSKKHGETDSKPSEI
jgi:hypothetical protein